MPHGSLLGLEDSTEEALSAPVPASDRTYLFRPIYDSLARGKLISRNDLEIGMQKVVEEMPGTVVTEEHIDKMMELGDVDRSGKIDFAEFCLLFEDIPDEEISLASLAQYWLGVTDSVSDPQLLFENAWRRCGAHSPRPLSPLRTGV